MVELDPKEADHAGQQEEENDQAELYLLINLPHPVAQGEKENAFFQSKGDIIPVLRIHSQTLATLYKKI